MGHYNSLQNEIGDSSTEATLRKSILSRSLQTYRQSRRSVEPVLLLSLKDAGYPGWCGSVDWTLSLCARRLQVRLRSKGHMPRLWASWGACRRDPRMFTFIWRFLSVPLPSSLFKKEKVSKLFEKKRIWLKEAANMLPHTDKLKKRTDNHKHGIMAIESNQVIKSRTWILKDNGMSTSFSAVSV